MMITMGSYAVLDLTSPWVWVALAIIVVLALALLVKFIAAR
jgi:hypothetical protein